MVFDRLVLAISSVVLPFSFAIILLVSLFLFAILLLALLFVFAISISLVALFKYGIALLGLG